MVSLKSSSSVEFETKDFLNFVIFSRSYRGLKFCVNTGCLAYFVHFQCNFSSK